MSVRLSIPAILRNPIFEREFLGFCRVRRWFVLRTLLVAVMVGALHLALVVTTSTFEETGRDTIGRAIFATLAYVELLFLAFLVPGLAAGMIAAERRRNTLEILLITPMRPLGIVVGKLAARVALVLVLVAATFPLLAVSLLYGGVRGEQLLDLFAVLTGTVLFLAGIALFVSTFARRVGTAAALSYLIPIAYAIAVMPIVYLLTEATDGFSRIEGAMDITCRLHPLWAVSSVAIDEIYLRFRSSDLAPWLTWFAIGAGVASLGVVLSALRLAREKAGGVKAAGRADRRGEAGAELARLRGELLRRKAAAAGPEESAKVEAMLAEVDRTAAAVRDPDSAPDPGGARLGPRHATLAESVRALEGRMAEAGLDAGTPEAEIARRARTGTSRRRSLGCFRNPVLWKEAHLVNATHSRGLLIATLSLLLLAEVLFFALVDGRDLRDLESHSALVTIEGFVLLVVVAVNASTSVAVEREQGTLELLHATLLTPAEITTAKFVGTLRSVAGAAVVPIGHMILAVATLGAPPLSALLFVVILGLLLAFFTTVGLAASILASRPSRAILRSMLVLGGLTVGNGILCLLILLVTLGGADGLASFLIMGNPPAVLAMSVQIFGGVDSDEVNWILGFVFWAAAYAGIAATLFSLLPRIYSSRKSRLAAGRS